MDSVAATVQRLIVVRNNNEPVFRIKLHAITQVLCVRRLRRHRSQSLTRSTFLILDLVELNVVTVRLLWTQQLATHNGSVNHLRQQMQQMKPS